MTDVTGDELFFTLPELIELFQYKTVGAARVAIHKGTFPVPTYRLGRRVVADAVVVKQYFAEKRHLAKKDYNEMYGAEVFKV